MDSGFIDILETIRVSIGYLVSEGILFLGIFCLVVSSFFHRSSTFYAGLAFVILASSLYFLPWESGNFSFVLFGGMLRSDNLTAYLCALIDIAGILTILMTWRDARQEKVAEYYTLIIAAIVGAHLLVLSMNLLMLFLSLEIISISSYALAGFAFTKRGAEGSLKYFLFGSVASAIMLYGLSMLYGMTGTLDFASVHFAEALMANNGPLFFIAGLMVLAGLFYKMALAPLHPWAPDVYEASPMPIVAFFSVVPKLAAVGILVKFILVINLFGQSAYDWQSVLSVVAMVTLIVGNFSALWQKNTKRLMAYSSIAQSGFLLIGVIALLPIGIQYMLFYATVYMLTNFLVFIYLQYFEKQGLETIASFTGLGKVFLWPCVFLLIGFVSLIGLPPTAGFTGKLLIFSSLWESYQLSGKTILLWLLIFGLLNTVVSLFYYLRIPYFAFIKSGESSIKTNNLTFENLFALILVLVVLLLFFSPVLLMGWINKITFVP